MSTRPGRWGTLLRQLADLAVTDPEIRERAAGGDQGGLEPVVLPLIREVRCLARPDSEPPS